MRKITQKVETWEIAGSFRIAHGSVSEIAVVQVDITDGAHKGRGECRPYARYEETPESVCAEIDKIVGNIENGANQTDLQDLLPAGAARNAVDCALWDLAAKRQGRAVWELAGLPKPRPRTTAFTPSIDSPELMAKAARAAHRYPVLKLKIGGPQGLDACLAVLEARPDAKLIIDANESLNGDELTSFKKALGGTPVLMIEQPLPANQFDEIGNQPDALPIICADESLHTRADLQKLWDAGYRAVNVKLDKCGGLTEAIALMQEAKSMDFHIMAGCMVGTSLAMAPMLILESLAQTIDLDGPLLLAKDIDHGLEFDGAQISLPSPKLWG